MPGDVAVTFVDSNIWLYALVDAGDAKKTKMARAAVTGRCWISTQVINEVCVNLLRKAGRSEDEIAQLIECFFRQHSVILVGEAVMLRAVSLRQSLSLSYWDSLIVASALLSGATRLFTEDLQDGLVIEGQMEIVNPLTRDVSSY